MKMKNRFNELDLRERAPEEIWSELRDIVKEETKGTSPIKEKFKKANWLSFETLKVAEEKRKAKNTGSGGKSIKLNPEFWRMARRDKEKCMDDQCRETEDNSRKGETRDLFKRIGEIKGTFQAKMGIIKDS